MDGTSIRKRVKRVMIASQKPRGFARRAQVLARQSKVALG